MTREINTHKVNGLNEAISILEMDEPGSGGANHDYILSLCPTIDGQPKELRTEIHFQNGPIASPADCNGLSNESLLAVVIDRMSCFQAGPFACRENALALTKLQEAMMWLKFRTESRVARGVEGALQK